MKAPNKGNRPIPILTEDGGDYKNGAHFKTTMSLISAPKKDDKPIYKFSIALDFNCPPLEKLLLAEKAKIVICLEQDTVRKFLDYVEGMTIEVDASDLRLSINLDVTPIIIAVEKTQLDFDDRYMESVYGLFKEQSFRLENRQILGYGQVVHIKTNTIKGLSQIIAFEELKKRDNTHPFKLVLDGPKIIVSANTEIIKNIPLIQKNSTTLEGLVNTSLAYVIFYQVILAMVTDPDAYSSLEWYSPIVSKINKIRFQNNLPEFDPQDFKIEHNSCETWHEKIWTLTSQLLTDNNGQLMLLSFEKAGNYAEGKQ